MHDNGVGANDRVISDDDAPQELGAGADVDMPSDDRCSARSHRSQRDLLKNQAVWPDLCIGMNHHAIRVGQQQPASDLAGQGDVRTRYSTPETVPKSRPPPQGGAQQPPVWPALEITDAGEQALARAPFPRTQMLSAPIRLFSADRLSGGCLAGGCHWETGTMFVVPIVKGQRLVQGV